MDFLANIFFAVLFLVGIIWGWEGQEERQLFALFSALFMFPLWFLPLFTIIDNGAGISFSSTPGWLPTGILVNLLWWNVVLMYFTGAHLMETLGRQDPLSKGLKKLRKGA